jgi:hypothetical protein
MWAWWVALVLVVVGVAQHATATTTEYIDQNSFLAGINQTKYLETFDSQPYGTVIASPLNFSGSGFSYSASANGGFYNIKDGTTSDVWLSTQGNTVPLTLTFSSNVTAVGGSIFATDYYGTAGAGQFTFVLDDNTLVTRTLDQNSFEGFISSLPINSLTIYPQSNASFVTINDLYVGTKLPEPSGLAVMLVAGAGLLSRRARRRAPR